MINNTEGRLFFLRWKQLLLLVASIHWQFYGALGWVCWPVSQHLVFSRSSMIYNITATYEMLLTSIYSRAPQKTSVSSFDACLSVTNGSVQRSFTTPTVNTAQREEFTHSSLCLFLIVDCELLEKKRIRNFQRWRSFTTRVGFLNLREFDAESPLIYCFEVRDPCW